MIFLLRTMIFSIFQLRLAMEMRNASRLLLALVTQRKEIGTCPKYSNRTLIWRIYSFEAPAAFSLPPSKPQALLSSYQAQFGASIGW